MKKRLITIATPDILPTCKCFIDNHREYAGANKYEFSLVMDTFWKDLHPSYSKVHEIQAALLDDCDIVLWADADVIFMDCRMDLANLVIGPHFLAAYQQSNWPAWPYLCAGLTVWKNGLKAQSFVADWVERCEKGSPLIVPGKLTRMLHEPWEQWYMDELVRGRDYDGIRPCTAKEIGCFAPEIWQDGTIWQDGMPTVHLAGPTTWERRAEIFRDSYYTKIKC